MKVELELLAAALGFAAGALYAISGFADSGKSSDLSKNPRVKNALWVLLGASAVVFADWRSLVGDDIPTSKLELGVAYGCGVLVGTIATLSILSILIILTVRARSKISPLFKGRTAELVQVFVTYGNRYYRDTLHQIDVEASRYVDSARALSETGVALSLIMAVTRANLDTLKLDQLDNSIDQVLVAMESTVRLFAAGHPELKLRSNYMVRVPVSEGPHPNGCLFTEPNTAYDSFLTLRRYHDDVAASVCLPIEIDARSLHVLPGAPSCVTERAATHINIAKLHFRQNVPQKVRRQITDFFKPANYASVLSVPLIWRRTVVGVANIESNEIDIVGKGQDAVEPLGKALAPYCVILGELVHHSEELRHAA